METLPLEFDGSSNMMELVEVSLDSELGAPTTTSRTMSSGSGLLLPNLLDISNSGRMSPVRERTMKEYDQDLVEDQRDNLGRLEAKVADLEGQLHNKVDVIRRLEEEQRDMEVLKDLSNQLEQVTKELREEKKLGPRRYKTIIGLVSQLHEKKEVVTTKARLSKTLGTLSAELHKAEMANHQKLQLPSNQQQEATAHLTHSLTRAQKALQVSVDGGTGEPSGDELSCDGEMRLLQLHLAELQRLQACLEQLDTDAPNVTHTSGILEQSKENFDEAGLSPPKSKSPRKPYQPI